MNPVTPSPLPLSARLKHETADLHQQMHVLMESAQPFADRQRYSRFVAAQYHFQRDVEHLFDDPGLQAAVPDLQVRGREAAALADLADLGTSAGVVAIATADVRMPEALGWLYVSEGSTLGAAFLLKEVRHLGLDEQFGARNLAAYPEGRAVVWRRFVDFLDRPGLSPQAQQAVLAGATAAFARFGALLRRHFALA
ncbi:MAG TPA: biliverdin-producing heme oxygenase [Herbaspirillum sp.]|uniref:biliverdin-producing heme oxygenase n=1 Tax=Herbaspirillum sp. TaxID=1890675 RepID=UPI002D27F93C|nr:biliverdin-producing heme oxygenase [Herbaspirillum sp.]HZG18967.1 biliverdin-producing heme oxygenase [Herbaspirillum sp.]